MEWIYLIIAGMFEIVWAVELKFSNGFTRVLPSIFTVAGMITSFYFLALSLKRIPLGTAYAIWTGIGIIGTVVFGLILFKESLGILRILFITLIIAGVIGLKFVTVK